MKHKIFGFVFLYSIVSTHAWATQYEVGLTCVGENERNQITVQLMSPFQGMKTDFSGVLLLFSVTAKAQSGRTGSPALLLGSDVVVKEKIEPQRRFVDSVETKNSSPLSFRFSA
ncbi:MAG: hypothetical protein HY074_03515 [Deltaproteobacteria bacterium]|nr:hypothetical protein [Deltaproteobacteria bacterium]